MARVNLRRKPIKGNLISLYYDFYPPIKPSETQAETRREFTGKFLYSDIEYQLQEYVDKHGKLNKAIRPVLDKHGNPKKRKLTAEQHLANEETLLEAVAGEVNRQRMINKGDYSFLAVKAKTVDFIVYCERLAKERTGSTVDGWTSFIKHLKQHTAGSLPITSVNWSFCDSFKQYLLSVLGQNTAATYFHKFKATLKEAYSADPQIIAVDLNSLIESIPEKETKIDYLTAEELQLLINKPFPELPLLKSAAIFSALTNLRYGDIAKLKWSEIQWTEATGHYISFTTEKNRKAMVIPIPKSSVSVALIGERREPEDLVFPGLAYSSENNKKMRKWVKSAGITKHMTFHGFRHTWAVLQQERGTDLHTQSKMMSHSDVKPTQIYSEMKW
jgi:integrase